MTTFDLCCVDACRFAWLAGRGSLKGAVDAMLSTPRAAAAAP